MSEEKYMKKILVIGQAPPYQVQDFPYSTTMLYDWLNECGITKLKAQEIFDWDAVYNKFPGFSKDGHKVPTEKEMATYWPTLKKKIEATNKVILLGNVAKDWVLNKECEHLYSDCDFICLMHPSRMNYNRYIQNKDRIINQLKEFINK